MVVLSDRTHMQRHAAKVLCKLLHTRRALRCMAAHRADALHLHARLLQASSPLALAEPFRHIMLQHPLYRMASRQSTPQL